MVATLSIIGLMKAFDVLIHTRPLVNLLPGEKKERERERLINDNCTGSV